MNTIKLITTLILTTLSFILFSQKIHNNSSITDKKILRPEKKKKGKVFQKTLTYNYNNAPQDLKKILKKRSDTTIKAMEFLVKGYWLEKIVQDPTNSNKSSISIELRDFALAEPVIYQAVTLDDYLIPSNHYLQLKIIGRDTNLVLPFSFARIGSIDSHVIPLGKSDIITTSIIDVESLYDETIMSEFDVYLKKIKTFNECYKDLEKIELVLEKLQINDQTTLENLLSYKSTLEKYSYCQRTNCTSDIPSQIIASKDINSLNSSVQSIYNSLNLKLNNLTKDLDRQFYIRGEKYYNLQRYTEAEADAEQALKINKEYVPALALLSKALLRRGGVNKAIDAFKLGYNYLSTNSSFQLYNTNTNTNTNNREPLVDAGYDIIDYFFEQGDIFLNKSNYDQADKTFRQAADWCDQYTLLNCNKDIINKKITSVRRVQLNDQLDIVERLIQTQSYQKAIYELNGAIDITDKYSFLALNRLNNLRTQAIRGRWNQLILEAKNALSNAIENTFMVSYDKRLGNFQSAYQAINIVNQYRVDHISFLPGTYDFSIDELEEAQYLFHLEYAEKYFDKGKKEKSLEEFKIAKTFIQKERLDFTNSYSKVFNSYHDDIATKIKDLVHSGISSKEEKLFDNSKEWFRQSEEYLEYLKEIEDSWLLKQSIQVRDSYENLIKSINNEQRILAKTAITDYVKQKNFELAKNYNKLLISKGGNSLLKTIEKENLLYLKSEAASAKSNHNYRQAVSAYNKAIKLYDKYNFTDINRTFLREQLLTVAKSFAMEFFPQRVMENKGNLSQLEDLTKEFSNWIKENNIPKNLDYISNIDSSLNTSLGEAVSIENKSLRDKLEYAINEKNYIKANSLLSSNHFFLETYDEKYEMNFTDIKSKIPIIKECSLFQQGINNALRKLEEKPLENVSELYKLEQEYFNNTNIQSRLNQPEFIPLFNFLQQRPTSVLFAGVEVFHTNGSIDASYQLLIQYLNLDNSNTRSTDYMQKAIGISLANLDKSSQKFNKQKEALKARIPKKLAKKMKTFKKSYKKTW